MSKLRFHALKEAIKREPIAVEIPSRLSKLYNQNVFSDETMQEYLTKSAYKYIVAAKEKGEKIPREIADQVSSAMKEWALSKGATHYTHWFQPLTGTTAEKHDAFFNTTENGNAIEQFNGSMLVQQEPDASSFPSGGIRNTFEARGYSAWDPTSSAFIIDTTLCIPSVFISYTGETLDYKTPLLRALQAVDEAATDVARYFDRNVNKVYSTLGWEQEYFLVDAALFNARPDLQLTGRTLLGHSAAKGQQLGDHYFGSISLRVIRFMQELEVESLKLGIPVKTRHNETAPNQFECAPIFEEANQAVDHNSLLMDVMARIAKKHHFRVLLHEKPFVGVNGSGKHNNWSLSTDRGENLLSPGKNPKKNLQFLTFFINTIKAVSEYGDILRSSIATASNDHRLGAHEAPPAIISIFIGSQLSAVLDELEKVKKGKLSPDEKTDLKLNIVGKIPEILLDNTDRNRTSPFAFTGNKFEFRAVGSSANCAEPMMVLNTIVAHQLKAFKKEVDALIAKGLKKDEALFNVLRDYIKTSKQVLFEGDGYSDSWEKEAAKRGLRNLRTTPEALKVELEKKFMDLFIDNAVLSQVEIEARNELKLNKYCALIDIEAQVLADLARNHIIPTAILYQNKLIRNVQGLKEIFEADEFQQLAKEQMDLIRRISEGITGIKVSVDELLEQMNRSKAILNSQEMANTYANEVKPIFDTLRTYVDELEMMVDDEIWPLVKYRELLFTK
ncbi:MAG TPA: glutamine synthetase III [Moheibacter sp.]|nr:glutamine synthetase III [Moheibacter sp.]